MDKEGTCYPGDEALMQATGMGRGHFSEYRKNLIEAGMIEVEVRKTKNGDSYTYSIPEQYATNGGSLKEHEAMENATYGAQTATNGDENATNGDENATSGGRNTVNNTTNNTVENTTSADAPVYSYSFVVRDNGQSFSNSEDSADPLYLLNLESVTGPLTVVEPLDPAPQSQVETAKRILTPGEKRHLDNQLRIYRVDPDAAVQVTNLVKSSHPRTHIEDAVAQALRAVGVQIEEEEWA